MKHMVYLLFFCGFLLSQNNGRQVQNPPTLLIRESGKIVPIQLEKLEVQVSIRGLLAETAMTLTFLNTENRVLEGELIFPLSEGATICGYGLDINGELVDGVIVEKHQARIAFEKEVRKGIDPGLVEWVKGNNFRTRIYPIPANGRRIIQVRYVNELRAENQDCFYFLPLSFKEKIKHFSLSVSIWGSSLKPTIAQGDFGLIFRDVEGVTTANVVLENCTFQNDFYLKFSDFPKQLQTIEQDSEKNFYFLVQDTPVPEELLSSSSIQKVNLFWDASLSREKSDKEKEFSVLRLLCKKWQTFEIQVVVFRNEADSPQIFQVRNGDSQELEAFLGKVSYDGGTNLSILKNFQTNADLQLLFTDGLANIGEFQAIQANSPFYCLSSSTQMDAPFLKYLSEMNNGQFFNLLRQSENDIAERIGSPSFAYLGAEYNGKEITEVYPSGKESISGRFDLTGQLLVEEASITLKYGYGNQVFQKVSFSLKRNDSMKTGLVPRFWAQKKVLELALFPDKNQKQLLALGQRYGLVTPGTSLLVLENLEQYLEHNVEPPASRPELRNQWLAKMDELWAEKNKKQKEKIEEVIAFWQNRVEWWNTDFSNWEEELKKKAGEKRKTGGITGSDDFADSEEASERGLADGSSASEQDEEAPAPEPIRASNSKTPQKEEERQIDIVIKPWDPQIPYIQNLKSAESEGKSYQIYLQQRKNYRESPSYYLDCANYFFQAKEPLLAKKVLSSILDLELENPALLRVMAYRLAEAEEFDWTIDLLREVLRLRPEEPQSYRDLALVLTQRAEKNWSFSEISSAEDFKEASELFYQVVMGRWDRFVEIETIALMELNRLFGVVNRLSVKNPLKLVDIDSRLLKLLDVDVRILLSWDADLTDVDLWVIEPTGEKAYYGNQRSVIGGNVSRDFTQGYGPEEYCLKRLIPGVYVIKANYYGSRQQSLVGPATVKATVYTNYGRVNEQKKELTLRLGEVKEEVEIGQIELK